MPAEKTYNFTLIVRDGKTEIVWDANQGMGESCHAASDALLPGQAVSRRHHSDPPDKATVKKTSPQYNQQILRQQQELPFGR
jgi:hypothetical protein